ncbi:putative SCO-spondin-like [Apostichopus japonicus]|uniref:Putative SCO-spondin-like n=1 Tax=Stichopus japonicus TaxID=307972 RepID=A0A2G8JVV2_STIJA|nr:putative SCO-spondin-like [Apostichopus japonicus]
MAAYPLQFVASWSQSDPGEPCDHPAETVPCEGDNSLLETVQSLCSIPSTAAEFHACHDKVDPNLFYKQCVHDLCQFSDSEDELMEALCVAMETYARECARQKVALDWRNEDFCPKTCGDVQLYSECGTLCPPTCNAQNSDELQRHCNSECISGCQCPPGTVLDDGRCLTVEQCPCTHNREKYPPGASIPSKCNTCVCNSGMWNCTQDICQATCQATGDPHYLTFDNKKYDFQGRCRYILVEDFVDNSFSVVSENVECGVGKGVTCTRAVTVIINGTTVQLLQGMQVLVNNEEITVPFVLDHIMVRRGSAQYVIVESFGVLIKWDGRNKVYVTLTPTYMHKVRGLCGTFDANQNNDFMTPAGDVETNAISFANKFSLDPECIEDVPRISIPPCDLNSHMKTFSYEKCGLIKESHFRPCHGSVGPDIFFDMCTFDVCACDAAYTNDCLCEAIASYATECASNGVFIEWRDHPLIHEFCGVTCSGGQVYQECGSTCGQTCRDLSIQCSETDDCVEGCNCPTGTVLDDEGNCIRPAECPCQHDDKSYMAGTVIDELCEVCTCVNGSFHCEQKEGCEGTLLCPANQVYDVHATPCPETCENMEHYTPCTSQSRPGCSCPDGYVLDPNLVVFLVNSICGKECRADTTWKAAVKWDFMASTSDKAVLQLFFFKVLVSPLSSDVILLHSASTCSAIGEGHYQTFDGRSYSFVGDCRYTLLEEVNGTYSVEVENVQCGSGGITCTRTIEITLGESEKITLVKGGDISVNDVAIQVPKYYANWKIERSGLFYVFQARLGLQVLWDAGTRVYVSVEPKYEGALSGLCGNFDGNQRNDFQARNGMFEQLADNFANSWKISTGCSDILLEDIQHPCEVCEIEII